MENINKLCKKCTKQCKSSDKVQIVECKSSEHRDDGVEMVECKSFDQRDESIYLVKGKSGLVKIGYTTDMEKEFSQLQSSTPHELEMLYHTEIKPNKIKGLKKLLHKEYENKRVEDDWYDLTQTGIKNVIKIILFMGK